jgi:pilus assembly protein CpaF
MEGDIISLQDLFLFDYGAGIDEDGKFRGQLQATGLRPRFVDRLAEQGIKIAAEVFAPQGDGRK